MQGLGFRFGSYHLLTAMMGMLETKGCPGDTRGM